MDEATGTAPLGRWSHGVRRHEVLVFYALLLCLSWPYLVLTAEAGRVPSRMLPLILVGPSVCAFLVAYAARGGAGVRALARRALLWRARWWIYALILVGLPLCFLGAAYAVAALLFPGQAGPPSTAAWINAAVNATLIFVFAGLGEEFGWRGLALPRLQRRHGPLVASALVGLMWSAWHLPVWTAEPDRSVDNTVFLVSVVAATFFYTWLFNSTGGSVLLVALLHTMENTLGWPYQDVFSFDPPGFWFFDAVKAAVWVLVALVVAVVTRGLLGLRSCDGSGHVAKGPGRVRGDQERDHGQ